MVKEVVVNDAVKIGGNRPFVLIAGPCVIEDKDQVETTAQRMQEIAGRVGVPYVFKASFDKANRSSLQGFRGPGLEEGLRILQGIKEKFSLPVLTDIHTEEQAKVAGEVVDIIQIPAFLCRQTDLLLAAGRTQAVVNVKKGQFLAPWDIDNVVEKIVQGTGNERILLTERGVTFGYNNLVVDMTALPRMRATGYPVVFDATHSVQLPGGAGTSSAGRREFVPTLARAAAAVGIDALFLEVHECPDKAKSDGPNMVPLDQLEDLLRQVKEIDTLVKSW